MPVSIRGGGGSIVVTQAQVDTALTNALTMVQVAVETTAMVQEGGAVNFPSLSGDFQIRAVPTMTAPRIRITLPAGRTLIGIYDGAVDITTDFTVDAINAQVYHANRDFAFVTQLWVRTRV